eukprot:312861_1
MGTSNCNITCTCFSNDSNISDISEKRLFVVKWMWTYKHHNALLNTVHSMYGIPKVISHIIEHYAVTDTEAYYITSTRLCNEKVYKNNNCLLKKPLCTSWFSQYSPIISPINMVIVGKNILMR